MTTATVSPSTTTSTTTGPIGRVTALSLAAGLAAALVLTLAVFPGATESTITGGLLVGFGLGWALLHALSTRFTSAPQSWAKVPAVFMGATGAAVVALHPGDAALTALNWVWPMPVLALAVWMRRQQRGSAPKRVRVLLAPVTGVLVLASLGATYQDVASARDTASYPAPGKLYVVDGHDLHLDCHGDGEPTTVLFNGMGGSSAAWAWVSSSVAADGRVCAYDRAGQGWSEATDQPQDAREAAGDLHAVLEQAGIEGPYVLAGHSTGGPFAMTYAATYPGEVAGMVLVDSSSPHQFDLPAYPGQYAVMRRSLALTPTLWRVGLGHVGSAVVPSLLPEPAASQVEALSANPRYARDQRDEVSVVRRVFEEARALTSIGSRPLAVLTASYTAEHTEGWPAAQDELARLSTDHLQRVVESTHAGMLEDEAAAAQVADAIREVVEAVRHHTALTHR